MRGRRSRTKSLGLGARIAILPLMGLLALLLFKGMDVYIGSKVDRASSMGKAGYHIAWMMTERVLNETNFLNHEDDTLREQIDRQSAKINEILTEAKSYDNDGDMRGLLEQVEKAATEHHSVFAEASKAGKSLSDSKARFMAQLSKTDEISKKAVDELSKEQANLIIFNGGQFSDKKISLISGLKELTGFISSITLNMNDLYTSSDVERFEQKRKELAGKLKIVFANNAGMVAAANDPKYSAYWKQIDEEYKATMKTQDTLFTQWSQLKVAAADLEKSNAALKTALEEMVKGSKQKIEHIERQELWLTLVSIGTMVVLLVLISALVIRSIVGTTNRVVVGLDEVANQVAGASGQVASASQQLASGASEQAASLEEISSSLEEMSSMTRQNAANAHNVSNLMRETKETVGSAKQSMEKLITSMGEISRASDETSKIIKTIDEIAFQTNLLALNAAVEAARAGESGAGFAVVADEVRNLAMRAAEAAKNTAVLIEGTVKKVKEGSDLVNETDNDFHRVTVSVGKSSELVGEITEASSEQAQGIEQINRAVSEMDHIVQQNAANAEETASASEEMNGQTLQMKGLVGDLIDLVKGNKRMTENHLSQAPGTDKITVTLHPSRSPKRAPGRGGDGQGNARRMIPYGGKRGAIPNNTDMDPDDDEPGELKVF